MEISKRTILNLSMVEVVYFFIILLINYYINRVSVTRMILGAIILIFVYLGFEYLLLIFKKKSEERAQRLKQKIEETKHPLYFIRPRTFYFTWILSAILLILIIISIYTFGVGNEKFGGTLGVIFLVAGTVFVLAISLYYLYISKKISLTILMFLIILYFVVIPFMIIMQILFKTKGLYSSIVLIIMIFVLISLIASAIYIVYILPKYVLPGLEYQKTKRK